MKYKTMDDWLFEIENYGLRIERMYEDLGLEDCDDVGKYARLLVWLNAAFEAARLEE